MTHYTHYGSAIARKAGTPLNPPYGITRIASLRQQAHFKRTTDPPVQFTPRLAHKPPGYRARRDAFADELDARADQLALALLGRL